MGGILMDVRSGQKATLEKVKKQKKNQESMTSQKSKKESGISQKGHLCCQPWPAPPSVPQGTTPSSVPKRRTISKVRRVPAKGNRSRLKKVTIRGVRVPGREISSKSQETDIISKEAFRSHPLPDYNEGAVALMCRS